jgi:hypothetical protein
MDAFLSRTAAWYRASLPFRVRFKRLACGETAFELGLKPGAASCPAKRYRAKRRRKTAGRVQTASRDICGRGQLKTTNKCLLFNINYQMRTRLILGWGLLISLQSFPKARPQFRHPFSPRWIDRVLGLVI